MVTAFFILTLIVAAALIEHLAWIRRAFPSDVTDLIDEPDHAETAVAAEAVKVEDAIKKAV